MFHTFLSIFLLQLVVAIGTTASDHAQDFHADLLENLLLFLPLQSEAKRAQPFTRALRTTVQSEGLQTLVTCLGTILRVCPATLPYAEVFFRHPVAALAAGPTPTNSNGARLADSAVNVPRSPSSSSEFGFGLKHFARDTRLLNLACQANSVEAALSLPMLDWKVIFYVPLFAHVALPWCADIGVVFTTFPAYPVFVISFPLSRCEGATLPSFAAGGARPFFAVFC